MKTKTMIITATAIILLIFAAIIFCNKNSSTSPNRESDPGRGYTNLVGSLNASGIYSLSYVNAHGKRIAAFDEMGNGYYFIYSRTGEPEVIIDDNNNVLRIGNNS